jgi:hypothetical protein
VVYDLAKNPSFVHREPIVKVGLDAGLERDAHPVMDKPEVAHEGRALVFEIYWAGSRDCPLSRRARFLV